MSLEATMSKARKAAQRGDTAEAERLYGSVLARFPGNVRARQGIDQLRSVPQQPALPQSDVERLVALYRSGALAETAALAKALSGRHPTSALCLNMLGAANIGLGQFEEARAAYARAAELDPGNAELHSNHAIALGGLDRLDEAVAAFARALALRPDYVEAHFNLGNALRKQQKIEPAIASYERAVAVRPDFAGAWNNLGSAYQQQNRATDALDAYRRAVAIQPDFAGAWNNLGYAYQQQHRSEDALDAYGRALAIQPSFPDALHNLGNLMVDYRNWPGAIDAFRLALELDPERNAVRVQHLFARANICDFSAYDDYAALRSEGAFAGARDVEPFPLLVFEDDPARQLATSRAWVGDAGQEASPVDRDAPAPGARLRIGYFSADFHEHATLYLMSGLLREHDRDRFEIVVYSYGPASNGPHRARLMREVERFVDVSGLSDQAIVDLARGDALDIAVDLKGHTQHTRSRIFAGRMAPLQISHVGYPGSLGASYIDYLVADPVVIPVEEQEHYSEKIIRLAGSYQPNDQQRAIAATRTTRADFGLPADDFVFCCFNHNYKIGPREFDVWMRLLTGTEGSVLWLLRSNDWAEANLRREAEARGVDPARLIFAETLPHAEHLAGCGMPICFSTPSTSTPTPRRATRCGAGCRCSRGPGARSPRVSAPAWSPPSACLNWSPTATPIMRPAPCNSRLSPRCWPSCARALLQTG
jgi:predicted O-linked N-acetylglucosamine transferase (SPINDLY family)